MAEFVEVLDSIMGSGKTTNIIKWMEDNPNERYLYISPLLSEVGDDGRLSRQVSNITFETPSTAGGLTKCESLLQLLQSGANVACTHSLYVTLTEHHLDLIESLGYVLIADEEVDVIGGFNSYSKDDYEWLYANKMISHSDIDGMVSWIGDQNLGRHTKYYMFKQYCDSQCLYVTKRSNTMMVTQLPVRLMKVAKRVIILTYMFEGNTLSCFLKLKGIQTKPFTDIETEPVDKSAIRGLINLLPTNPTIETWGMTSEWYKNASKLQLNAIAKHIRNVADRHKAKFEDVMYTLPKDRHDNSKKNLVKPVGFYRKRNPDVAGGYECCWLASITRATNDYAHKSVLIHCYNRFPLVSVDSYLQDYGVKLDRQVFALSEMLQWIWRSRIRDGKPITISIANKRMYGLFKDWLGLD